jgi:hypothetical protein
MGFIGKRNGRYRARYRDPLGRQRSETFTRKADAGRFVREMQVDLERERWIDPAGADVALATWANEFLSLARRLSPTTQETYARDLRRYVLPRFGSYRPGRLPPDRIENRSIRRREAVPAWLCVGAAVRRTRSRAGHARDARLLSFPNLLSRDHARPVEEQK